MSKPSCEPGCQKQQWAPWDTSEEVVQTVLGRFAERKHNLNQVDYQASHCSSFPCRGSELCTEWLCRRTVLSSVCPHSREVGTAELPCCSFLGGNSSSTSDLLQHQLCLFSKNSKTKSKGIKKTKQNSAHLSFIGIFKPTLAASLFDFKFMLVDAKRCNTHPWVWVAFQTVLTCSLSPCWRHCVTFMGTNRRFTILVSLPPLSKSIHHCLPCGLERG